MNSIKRNPGKFIKLFGLLYFAIEFIQIVFDCFYIKIVYSYNVPLKLIIFDIIKCAPYVLFLVYCFALYKKRSNHILLPISYILLGGLQFFSLVFYIRDFKYMGFADGFGEFLKYGYSRVLSTLFCSIMLVFIVFYIVDCFSRFKYLRISKTLILIQTGLSVGNILLNVIFDFIYWGRTDIVSTIFNLVSTAVLMLAYIIFWRCGVTTTTSIEIGLYELKEQLDKGWITEEEFKVKKTEILNKL